MYRLIFKIPGKSLKPNRSSVGHAGGRIFGVWVSSTVKINKFEKIVLRELCPSWSKIQNINITTSNKKEKDKNGEIKLIQTITYHCEVCHHFVKSEDKVIKNGK